MSPRSGRLGPLADWLSTPHGQAWLRRAVWALLGIGLVAATVVGAGRPGDPHLLAPSALAATRAHSGPSRVAGFNQVGFRVISAARGGNGRPGCALLADTPARRAQGLMHRRDLGGYDAMVFRFGADTDAPFFNRGVPIPLSVAWFDAAGVYIGQADLAVCDAACPTVAPTIPFRVALEARKGGLGHLGVGAGAALLVGGACA